jgi:hypothetical protein
MSGILWFIKYSGCVCSVICTKSHPAPDLVAGSENKLTNDVDDG